MGVNNVSGTNQDLLCVDTSMLFAILSPWGPFFLAALTRQLKDKLREMHFYQTDFFLERDGADNMMGRRHRENTAKGGFLCDKGRSEPSI